MRGTGRTLIFFLIVITVFLFPLPAFAAAEKEYLKLEDIPGVDAVELAQIAGIRAKNEPLIIGMPENSEMFYTSEGGELGGFVTLYAEWLTALFDIEFKPVMVDWMALGTGLTSGDIDFTSEYTPNTERRRLYIMSNAIAQRTIKYFRLINHDPLDKIAQERPLRFVFYEGSLTYDRVLAALPHTEFEAVFVPDTEAAHAALLDGTADALIEESVEEASFDKYGDTVSEDFLPLMSNPVSLTTGRAELAPIISVVDKLLADGGFHHFTQLYNQGHNDYTKKKIFNYLTAEEREYIRTHETVRYAAEYDNYPTSFYNEKEDAWQGIFQDVLLEMENLTGMHFERVNGTDPWHVLLTKLENGEAAFISQLVRTTEREGRFLWPDKALFSDTFALVSKLELPDININELRYMRIGVDKNTVYDEMLRTWFPDHGHITVYDSINETLAALENDEIDFVMSSTARLLKLTHYDEQVGYKANYIIEQPFESTMGFNKNEEILCSIISKTLAFIDTEQISNQWLRRTYDYRGKLAEERQARYPILFGAACLTIIALFMGVLNHRSHDESGRLEVLVEERTAQLNSANRAKTDFLSRMSHEIRTPLNAIIGMATIGKSSPATEKKDYCLGRVVEASHHLLGVINDILDISKIESGKYELSPTDFKIEKMMQTVTDINTPRINDKKQNLIINIDPAVPNQLFGDDQSLAQVITNLLSNAVKFTPEGGDVFVDARLLGESNEVCELEFAVKDTGIGISPKQQETLFDAFQQAENDTSRKFGGTGLGLAISKNIVEMMGGNIRIESELGKGAAFIFNAKLMRSHEADAAEQEEDAPDTAMVSLTGKRVLLAEDIDVNREIVQAILEPTNIEVEMAVNGAEAVALFAQNPKRYDIIFMDVQMPEMDGCEATRIIRTIDAAWAREVPIIAMTANVFKEEIQRTSKAGMNGHIGKPLDFEEVIEVLNKYLVQ